MDGERLIPTLSIEDLAHQDVLKVHITSHDERIDFPAELRSSHCALGAFAAGATTEEAVRHAAEIHTSYLHDPELKRMATSAGFTYLGSLTWRQKQGQLNG